MAAPRASSGGGGGGQQPAAARDGRGARSHGALRRLWHTAKIPPSTLIPRELWTVERRDERAFPFCWCRQMVHRRQKGCWLVNLTGFPFCRLFCSSNWLLCGIAVNPEKPKTLHDPSVPLRDAVNRDKITGGSLETKDFYVVCRNFLPWDKPSVN
jgi:hypothetical protein